MPSGVKGAEFFGSREVTLGPWELSLLRLRLKNFMSVDDGEDYRRNGMNSFHLKSL